MRPEHLLSLGFGLTLALTACKAKEPSPPPTAPAVKPAEIPASAPAAAGPLEVGALVGEEGGIKISKLSGSPDFPDARVTLASPTFGANVEPKSTFEFQVSGFELGRQTLESPFLANSKDGQHIHFIVDNEPYHAKYQPKIEFELTSGSHVILAFPSRSYHESVKHTYVLTRVHVGEPTPAVEAVTLEGAPHLFYSRPKGEYVGADTKSVLLDFYLVGTDLSTTGNRVEATIAGQTFTLTEWAPYVMEGLPMGEVKIGLRLVDPEGQTVPGPYNAVERTITLKDA